MKKRVLAVLSTLMAGAMLFGMAGCSSCSPDDPVDPGEPGKNDPPQVTEMSLYERADYLARAVDDHYVTRSAADGLIGAGYYNALEGGTDASANCYEYSALIGMANRLYATSATDTQKAYYKGLIDDYVGGLDYYEGSGKYESTHGSYQWTGLYGVHRMEQKNTGDVSTDMVYDDLMWIIRDFVGIYKNTGDASYLTRAEHLTKACLDGWDSTVDGIGGITWGPTYNSKHTCSNGPLISALCELADIYKASDAVVTADETVYTQQTFSDANVKWENMVGMKKADYYLAWAEKVYDFTYTYLRESDYTFADNLRHERTIIEDAAAPGGRYWKFSPYTGSNEGSKYTYNTGSMISGAAWLYRLTGEQTYLTQGRLMAEGAYHYFAKTVEIGGKAMQMYDCRTTLLFNSVLLQGYLDLADACKVANATAYESVKTETAIYVGVFKTSINYAFDNYLINRTLPHNYLNGWLYASSDGAETFDTHKDVKDAAASPEMLAMIVQYESAHGEL